MWTREKSARHSTQTLVDSMALHLFSTDALANQLATGTVTAAEQAGYLAAGFVIWLLPVYLLVIPPPAMPNTPWFYVMWSNEFLTLAAINIAGVFYCLRRCQVLPKKQLSRGFLLHQCSGFTYHPAYCLDSFSSSCESDSADC
jgi:hypothetical protein